MYYWKTSEMESPGFAVNRGIQEKAEQPYIRNVVKWLNIKWWFD